MFIWKHNQNRCNPYAPYTDALGTRYSQVPSHLYEEIADPPPPTDFSDDFYYRTEQEDAPYVVYTKKSDEQIATVLTSKFTSALEGLYDKVAQQKHYDNRLTCALRAGYVGPFQAEGILFGQWMDNCNAYAYTVLASVKAGTTPMPSIEDFLVSLPAAPWPIEE